MFENLFGFDGLEEARLELQKSAENMVKCWSAIHSLLLALHSLDDPRIEELFVKYEIEFKEAK